MKLTRPLPAHDLDLVLQQTAPLWEDARNCRLFITGGTGFFGCWLVESFCHINRELSLKSSLTVLTRNPRAFAAKCPHLAGDPAVSLLEGDVRTFAFPRGQFSHVIHAATDTYAKTVAEEPLETFSTIIAGTERVLQFTLCCGARRFLLTSSGAVYGKQPDEITHVPETYSGAPDPLMPGSVYAEGKRAAELLCALFQQNSSLECKIARCWAFCGPHLPLNQHFAIGNFIGDVLAGRPIRIQGDGTPRRSYLYAADLAVWLWTILFRAPALLPVNVGSDRDVSILELAQTVAATLNPSTEILVAREPVPDKPLLRYVPSVDRARKLLELREITPLEQAIQRTANWYRPD
ncbi:MAG TPA: NAD-dependent epimerase/dehydratase family protein [Acidobacteriaceae bacterium]|jgi:dTDP-glucose 4,6-dehydratase|nr:NAD-dependent epimerase/dehydratase family protein [Acidobacteriaceae bacterium]